MFTNVYHFIQLVFYCLHFFYTIAYCSLQLLTIYLKSITDLVNIFYYLVNIYFFKQYLTLFTIVFDNVYRCLLLHNNPQFSS